MKFDTFPVPSSDVRQPSSMRQFKTSNALTRREDIALDKYLVEISKIPLLTPDQEVDLSRRIKSGDDTALNELTKANLRFVISVAKQYQNNGLSLSDLINEGNIGLIRAARRFDETKGFKFISYAVWWIRQAIIHAIIAHSRIVRIPSSKMAQFNLIKEAYNSFTQHYEREPSAQELALACGMSEEEVEMLWFARNQYSSIDAPIGNESTSMTMIDTLPNHQDPPDRKLMEESLHHEVISGMQSLSPREVDILTLYYGLHDERPHTHEEIAIEMGITRERVRQIKERALRRLRRKINKNLLSYS